MRVLLFSIFSLLLAASAPEQLPTDGHIQSGKYVNSFFHVTYTWPDTMQPVDTKLLHLPPPSKSQNEFLLFAARKGSDPFGVVILAERPSLSPDGSRPIPNGVSFLDHVIHNWNEPSKVKTLDRKHGINPNGLMYDELDYVIEGEFDSGVTARIGEYLIVFKFNAKSRSELDAMTASARSMLYSK